jgi:histidyl-tRNA synthetase
MSPLITPRTLQGFRDYLPALMMPRERLLETARRVYRSYGFAPIDTPALEYAEILCGKGGDETDKQMYRFLHGDRDVALRFDLTIPFARFAAMHIGELGTPFKRYAMGPVWRGERPQAGRYREFWQCDFDTIGTTSNAADIEVALVIHDLMTALEVGDFQIRVNNRLVLNGLLEELGIPCHATAVLRCLDKLGKVSADEVAVEMVEKAQVTREQAGRVLALASLEGSNADILDRLGRDFGTNARAAEGIGKLRELLAATRTVGISEDAIRLDLSIARGLDYYTGTIYETFLLGSHPTADGSKTRASYGSVCSGGRYDNLAGLYTKQTLPGVGASLGLDRLLAILEASKVLPKVSTPAPVLIVQFLAARVGDYQRLARLLRAAGIGVEVYPDAVKVGKQLQYASDRGFAVAIVAGSKEFECGEWKVKNLATREERAVPEAGVVEAVRAALPQ